MAKHRATETAEEIEGQELAAEAIACALRAYAEESSALSRGAFNVGEFTASSFHADNAVLADNLAAAFEEMRVSLRRERQGSVAA